MTKRQYRNYSFLFFFFSVIFSGFFVNAVFNQNGLGRLISVGLFGFVIFQQLRLALLMRRRWKEFDLK